MAFSVQETLPLTKPYSGNSGTCSDEVALKYLNAGRRLVWPATDTKDTTGYFCIRCVNECVTLPSVINQVRLAWYDRMPVSIGNEWYSSIPQVGFPSRDSCHQKFTQIGQQTVTFQNYDYPYQVALLAENPTDAGTVVTVGGYDRYSTYQKEDIVLGITPTYVLSTKVYKDVTTIVKPRTKGRVRLYAQNQQREERMLMAVYQPYDVNPYFLKYSSSACNKTLTVFAKKKYYDLVDMNDLVEFSPDALMHAIQAVVNRENKGQNKDFQENLQMAVNRINEETSDRENETGSPMRIFVPDVPHALIGDSYWGNGWSNGFGNWGGNNW